MAQAGDAQGIAVQVDGLATPERYPTATKFWVEGDGFLYVGNDEVKKLAVFAPGSWRRAKLLNQGA